MFIRETETETGLDSKSRMELESNSSDTETVQTFERESIISIKQPPKEIAFSGGGVKGIAFFGVLWGMSNKHYDYLNEIKRVAGTSIGSLVATIVALKIPINDVINTMFNFNLESVSQEYSLFHLGKQMSFLTGKSLKRLIVVMLRLVNAEHITFQEAYERTHIELNITVTNLNQETVMYLNHKQVPNLKLKKALMMSMALPGIFPRILHNNEEYCDGAVIDNFPTSILSKNAWGIRTAKSGIKLPKGPLSNFQYISKLFTIRYENSKHNTVHINNILKIIIDDVSTTHFELNDDDKLRLIIKGRDAFLEFISND